MSKIITSPIKRFPGTVTIADPLTFPQLIAYRCALEGVAGLRASGDILLINQALLPGILACVEHFDLERFELVDGAFPATPAGPIRELIAWLVSEIRAVVEGVEDIPLA